MGEIKEVIENISSLAGRGDGEETPHRKKMFFVFVFFITDRNTVVVLPNTATIQAIS